MPKRKQEKNKIQEQIYQLSTLVAGDFSLQEVLDKLTGAAVRITGVKACSIRLLDEETGELKMRSTCGLSEQYRSKGVVSRNDPVIKAAFAGQPVVLDDMRVDDRVKYKQAAVKEGLVSQLTVSMNFRNKPIGVLRIYRRKFKQFNEDDISLARAVASQCAVAITNARLYARAIEAAYIKEQMRLAGLIQRRMIPETAPVIAGLDIAATYIPCFDVGGDFYDFYQIDKNRFIVAIADVIGKGIPAAMMMSMFRGTIRAYADSSNGKYPVAEIIDKLNKTACNECRDGEFITLFYAVIEADKAKATYCNCGHEPPVLFKGDRIVELQSGGLVLGVESDAEYEIGSFTVSGNDCLLCYTDGLTDAVNFDGELWGRQRLLTSANKFRTDSAEMMIRNILIYRRRFAGLAKQIDDTSIIVIKATE